MEAITIIILIIGIILLFKLLNKSNTEIHPSISQTVLNKYAGKKSYGYPIKMKKAYLLSPKRDYPQIYIGKVDKVYPKAHTGYYKYENRKGEIEQEKQDYDIVTIRQQTGNTLFIIPKTRTITLMLKPKEHSPFLDNENLYIYAEAIIPALDNYYRTDNTTTTEFMNMTFEQSIFETYKDVLDNIGALSSNMLEANLPHIKGLERTGGVIKIVKRAKDTAVGGIKKILKKD